MKGNVDAVETRSENSADVLQSALKKNRTEQLSALMSSLKLVF